MSELRALVGSRPLILVGAGVLVVDGRGRLLLQRRSDDGRWGIPGGALELGESVEDAARRELREETGLGAGDLSLFGVFSGPEHFHVYPNGDQASIVSVVFLTRNATGTLGDGADAAETKELRYFTAGELAALPFSGANGAIVARFVAYASAADGTL